MDTITVFKGDSTEVKEFTIEGHATLDADWSGKKAVVSSLGEDPIMETVLEKASDDSMFFGYLTPAETTLLPVGKYIVIFEIENTTIAPQFRREVHYKLTVKQSGIEI